MQTLNKSLEIGYFSGQTLLMLEQILSEVYVPIITIEETNFQNEKKNKKSEEENENDNEEEGEKTNNNMTKSSYNKENTHETEDVNDAGSVALSESNESIFTNDQNGYNENNNNSGFLISMK